MTPVAAAAVVTEAAEALLCMGEPPATEAAWMQQRRYQQALQLVQPSAVLAVAAALPPAQLAALVQAALRTLDDVMHLALRDPHAGALPAATAVQMLVELLSREGARVPWALPAGCDRMARIVATPACPMPVMHAATHALRTLQAWQAKHAPPQRAQYQ